MLSAPSGAGKTTLSNLVMDHFQALTPSISYTTRKARPGECNGVEYRFIDHAEFERMVNAGEFAEHADVHGNRYGTSKADLDALLTSGKDVLMDIDVQGAAQIRSSRKGGIYIFIVPPSMEVCEERLRARGAEDEESIQRRLEGARNEIKEAESYDYIIINDKLELAAETLRSVIVAEHAGGERVFNKVEEIFQLN